MEKEIIGIEIPKGLIFHNKNWTVNEIIKDITVEEWNSLNSYINYSSDMILLKRKWKFHGTNVEYADALKVYEHFNQSDIPDTLN